MEFGLSQDQLMLDDSVRKFLASEVPLDKVRQLAAGETDDSSVWQGLADMGLAGLIIPEAHGGAELGMLDASPSPRLRLRRLPGPFLSTAIMSAYLLNAAGATDPWRAWLQVSIGWVSPSATSSAREKGRLPRPIPS